MFWGLFKIRTRQNDASKKLVGRDGADGGSETPPKYIRNISNRYIIYIIYMFYIYLYISMCLLIFGMIQVISKIFYPYFGPFLGHFRRIFVYGRCMNGTFLVQNTFKSFVIPLEHQIPSLCVISKSLKMFRMIESI